MIRVAILAHPARRGDSCAPDAHHGIEGCEHLALLGGQPVPDRIRTSLPIQTDSSSWDRRVDGATVFAAFRMAKAGARPTKRDRKIAIGADFRLDAG